MVSFNYHYGVVSFNFQYGVVSFNYQYCVVSFNYQYGLISLHIIILFFAPGAWLSFSVGAKLQEIVGALVSTKMWEFLYIYVQFLFVFHLAHYTHLFHTSPIMCGSVGSGHPVIIIVKVP
jgi:hypothetical protein